MLTNMMKAMDRSQIADPAGAVAVERLNDEVPEHVEQDVAGEHCDEWPKPEAEWPNEEADQLDRRDDES